MGFCDVLALFWLLLFVGFCLLVFIFLLVFVEFVGFFQQVFDLGFFH